ncbi:tail fiber protein [Terasakiella sp. A23]|uniref:phage tail protein n=1 Tax=Terasakiella sp. FCG-A23 TaxID=3080561 RepID=UPI00295545AE|nr:tail fiber protein [Terasakiella sp. A23]MDV7340348.1 tail fiber protein [Terasakiella sp. A23]
MKTLYKAGMVSGLALLATFATSSIKDAHACGPDAYMGTICITAATFCPRQYMELTGQLVSINEYSAVFAITGDTYGGDARTTFGLPDGRGRELVHRGQGPGLDMILRGEYTGFELAQIPSVYFPSHTHNIDFSQAALSASIVANSAPASETTPESNFFADTTAAPTYSSSANKYMAAGSVTATASAGSGTISVTGTTPTSQTAATAIGPQLGLKYCVAMDGLFPPRT